MQLEYTRLDIERPEIRLLTLLPGNTESRIQCQLGVAPLADAGSYEALSYVWGDPGVRETILVNGRELMVGTNLGSALRHLRHPEDPRILWVDAICINQGNVPEKNTQVPLMGEIYSSAVSVLAWLGDLTPELEYTISWCTENYPRARSPPPVAASHLVDVTRELDTLSVIKLWEGLLQLWSGTYWSRMWTFQEYWLARNIVCIAGSMVFTPHSCFEAYSALNSRFLAISLSLKSSGKISSNFDQSRATTNPDPRVSHEAPTHTEPYVPYEVEAIMRRMLDSMSREAFRSAMHLHRLQQLLPATQQLSVLLSTCFGRECWDPRDTVYSLYGIAEQARRAMPPDYGKSTYQVFLETTEYIINNESAGAHIFSCFALYDERLQNMASPSWVVDFVHGYDDACPHKHYTKHFLLPRLETNSRRAYIDAPPASTLHLWARNLGHCRILARFTAESRTNEISQAIMRILLHELPKCPSVTRGQALRALVAHSTSDRSYCDEELISGFEELFVVLQAADDCYAESEATMSDAAGFIERQIQVLAGRCLTVTDRGSFGISVGELADGDLAIAPPDVAVPLVLRRETNVGLVRAGNGEDDGEYFRMVGSAYFTGVMKGHVLDEGLVTQLEQEEPHEYLIH